MKLSNLAATIAFLALGTTAFAQGFPPAHIPPNNGGIFVPTDPDPILVNVVKNKSYQKTYGPTDANILLKLNASGTVFVVDDESGILARATGGANATGLASLYGHPLLGATASVDALAQNADFSYSGTTAYVNSNVKSGYLKAFAQVGPYVLLNSSKSFTGDIVFAPSFAGAWTKNIFKVSKGYTLGGVLPLTFKASADANVALWFNATLDPVVTGLVPTGMPGVGSKAKLTGAGVGSVTAMGSVTLGVSGASVGVQADLRLADTRVDTNVTASMNWVTGSGTLSVQPLAVYLRFVWSLLFWHGSDLIWSWASSMYVNNFSF